MTALHRCRGHVPEEARESLVQAQLALRPLGDWGEDNCDQVGVTRRRATRVCD